MRRIEPVRRERARAVGEPEDGFSYYVRSLTTVQLAQDTTKYILAQKSTGFFSFRNPLMKGFVRLMREQT